VIKNLVWRSEATGLNKNNILYMELTESTLSMNYFDGLATD